MYKSGNTVDLLLSNIPGLIKNLKVLDRNEFCLFDHYAMTFYLCIKVKYKSIPKRTIYNFDKGDYIGLNHNLNNINWDLVFCH